MDKRSVWLVSLLCLLYLWIGERSKVSGKCAGQWAIHACGGGNGKRSDDSLLPAERDALGSRPRFDLHSLLSGSIGDAGYDVRQPGYDVMEDEAGDDTAAYDVVSDRMSSRGTQAGYTRSTRAREILRDLVKLLRKRSADRR